MKFAHSATSIKEPAPRRLRRFQADHRGSITIIFAMMLTALVGIIGIGVDYTSLHDVNGELQAAADSAALSAVSSAMNVVAARGVDSDTDLNAANSRARTTAKTFFDNNVGANRVKASSFNVNSQVKDGQVSVTVSYAGSMPTRFARVLGFTTFNYAGASTAVAKLPPFVDLHILVDTSGSMAIGASLADQNLLRSETGCAFACHDGVPVKGYADAYAYAVGTGIALRYGAVNNGISALLDLIDAEDKTHQFVRTAVYSIDDALQTATTLTADTDSVRKARPSAPAISGEAAGATKFKDNIGKLIAQIGPGGDGSDPNRAIKLLIIATDGVEDPGRAWTSNLALRSQVDVFDMSFCEPAKASGLNVGIIHTPYVEMPWDWGYEATLGQPSQRGGGGDRVDDIAPVLKDCAGGRYVEAGNKAAIETAFTSIFKSLSAVHLTQ